MSTQRGNVSKSRKQKHQNSTSFKNSLHDTSKQTKEINKLKVQGVCDRCKEIIEWKIKYKKYKPLTAPKKCNKCEQKAVKAAYHTICDPCVRALQVCGKCGEKAQEPLQLPKTQSQEAAEQNEFKKQVAMLPERKRRTLFRYMEEKSKGKEKEKPPVTLAEINEKMANGSKDEEDFDSEDFDDLDELDLNDSEDSD